MYERWRVLGLPGLYVARVILQRLFIDIMSVTDFIYAL